MKLEPEERQRPVLDRCDRAGRGHRQRHKLRAGILYLVSVAHPDNCLVGYAMEEGLVGVEHLALGAAELTRRRALHLPPQGLGRQLHPVADAEHRDAHPEELRIAMRRAGSYTLLGPPERIKASGFSSRTRSGVMSWRTIRAKACRSRTRRAMSWTYCAPKSRTRTGRAAGSMSSMSFCVLHGRKPADGAERPAIIKPLV